MPRLAAEIAHHDELYYRKDQPEISDAAYDALRARNEEIEARFPHLIRDDSPSLRVGAAPVEAFGKVAHRVPMLSIGNAFDRGGACASFLASAQGFLGSRPDECFDSRPSPRSTGSPSRCAMRSGKLVQGATRGDGYEGENVTANVRTIADIPKAITAKDFPDRLRGARRDLYEPRRLSRG